MTQFKNPEYLSKEESAKYLHTTVKKIALFRQAGILKYCKLGKEFTYKKAWLDEFAETWAGYDLSNPEKIAQSVNEKRYREEKGI